MAAQGFLLIASFLLILLVLAKPLGSGLARLIAAVPLPGVAGVERILWRTLGITDHEMNWRQYLLALLTSICWDWASCFACYSGRSGCP